MVYYILFATQERLSDFFIYIFYGDNSNVWHSGCVTWVYEQCVELLNGCTCTQDPKLLDKLTAKHGDQLEEKSLTICSGVDYTNINYQHVVCPDVTTAKVWLILSLNYNEKNSKTLVNNNNNDNKNENKD